MLRRPRVVKMSTAPGATHRPSTSFASDVHSGPRRCRTLRVRHPRYAAEHERGLAGQSTPAMSSATSGQRSSTASISVLSIYRRRNIREHSGDATDHDEQPEQHAVRDAERSPETGIRGGDDVDWKRGR